MSRLTVISITLLLLALAGFLYINWSDAPGANFAASRTPTLAAGDFSVYFTENTFYQSVSDDLGFYILGRRVVRRYDTEGTLLWTRSISHTNPTFVQGGHYIALSAYRARAYYVFGPEGSLYTLTFDNDILSYHVACNGYSAVMSMDNSGGYNIEVFSASGTRVKQRVLNERNLFPVSMAISPDARILVVSYLDISGYNILSYICAYHIHERDRAHNDGLFASFRQIEGEIISKVRFIDSAHLMFSSDGQFGVYRLDSDMQFNYSWSIALENQAAFVDVISETGIAIAFGRPLLGAGGIQEGTFAIHGLDGTLIATYFMDGGISYLSTGTGAAIIGGGPLRRNFAAINYRGQVVWEYRATSDVLDFVLLDSYTRALIVTPTRMQIMEVR